MRLFLAGLPADRPVWPGTWAKVAWRMIAADLAEARAAWIAEAGADAEETKRRERSDFLAYHAEAGTVDFHSLRHSYISALARSGVHPKTVQTLARHSTIGLTMDLYTHVRLHDQAAALEALPSLLPAGRQGEAASMKATGTTDSRGRHCPQHVPAADSGRDFLRVAETTEAERQDKGDGRNPPPMLGVAADCDQLRGEERGVSEGI